MKLPRDFALLLATSFLEEGTHNNVKLWGLFFQNPLDGMRYLFFGDTHMLLCGKHDQ